MAVQLRALGREASAQLVGGAPAAGGVVADSEAGLLAEVCWRVAAALVRLATLPAQHLGVDAAEAEAAVAGDAGAGAKSGPAPLEALMGREEAAGKCACWLTGEAGARPMDSASHRRSGVVHAFACLDQLVRLCAIVKPR